MKRPIRRQRHPLSVARPKPPPATGMPARKLFQTFHAVSTVAWHKNFSRFDILLTNLFPEQVAAMAASHSRRQVRTGNICAVYAPGNNYKGINIRIDSSLMLPGKCFPFRTGMNFNRDRICLLRRIAVPEIRKCTLNSFASWKARLTATTSPNWSTSIFSVKQLAVIRNRISSTSKLDTLSERLSRPGNQNPDNLKFLLKFFFRIRPSTVTSTETGGAGFDIGKDRGSPDPMQHALPVRVRRDSKLTDCIRTQASYLALNWNISRRYLSRRYAKFFLRCADWCWIVQFYSHRKSTKSGIIRAGQRAINSDKQIQSLAIFYQSVLINWIDVPGKSISYAGGCIELQKLNVTRVWTNLKRCEHSIIHIDRYYSICKSSR